MWTEHLHKNRTGSNNFTVSCVKQTQRYKSMQVFITLRSLSNISAIKIKTLHISIRNATWMHWKQRTPTLNLFSLKSLSRSRSFSARASLSKARTVIMRPLPILRVPPGRRLSFSLFSKGLTGRRVWGASAALPWHPPPKLRRCGLSMTSKSSSFNRSRGSE